MNSHDLEKHTFRSPKLKSVVEDAIEFFSETPAHQLPPPERFLGAGVYALYYTGDYALYNPIAFQNRRGLSRPIYVGKAVSPGWRTAKVQETETTDLLNRLRQHARSIEQAENLKLADFECRFMILGGVECDLIGPVEAALTRRFESLWNVAVDGFGNHDPGAGRYNQAKSEWDVLHPGRLWAQKLVGRQPRPLEYIVQEVDNFLAS